MYYVSGVKSNVANSVDISKSNGEKFWLVKLSPDYTIQLQLYNIIQLQIGSWVNLSTPSNIVKLL